MTRLSTRVYRQLLRQFSEDRFKLEGDTYINRSKVNFCPDEAFTNEDFCDCCPNKVLCDGIMAILGRDIQWYVDCTIFEAKDIESAKKRLYDVVLYLQQNIEPIEPNENPRNGSENKQSDQLDSHRH